MYLCSDRFFINQKPDMNILRLPVVFCWIIIAIANFRYAAKLFKIPGFLNPYLN